MARSNFKVFAEGAADKDVQSDVVYNTDTQRIYGVVPGIAEPKMHNKLYKQATVMVAALAQVIVQAGFDALDSDYSGLVSNLRKSFAGSVNGVKPDESGNIDLTEVIEEIRKMTYPRVGDFIITKNPDNPSKKYKNTTWELLESKTFVMSAGDDTPVNSTGGSNTHINTVQEMPAHAHDASSAYAGGHSHSRGTMNITGTLALPTHNGRWNSYITGAFDAEPGGSNIKNIEGADFDEHNRWHDIGFATFDASRTWSGETSSVGNHNHTVSINSTGNGKKWDIRPKYIAAYIWVRTA